MSLTNNIKVNGDNDYQKMVEELSKLNASQLEELLKEFLKNSNTKITRSSYSPQSNKNFRVGLTCGVLLAAAVLRELESGLCGKDKVIKQLAIILAKQFINKP